MAKRGTAQVAPQPEDSFVGVVEEQATSNNLTGKYTLEESLVKAAEAGGAKLLSAKWLVEFNQTRGEDEPIQRQQDLPESAFIDTADLRAKGITKGSSMGDCEGQYIVLAISYCWLTPTHPDPKGQHVATLAHGLSLMLAWFNTCVDIAVFLDFCSLPQEPRDMPEEVAAFQTGLQDVNLWYAHALTFVFMLTSSPPGWPDVKAYAERGWPSFERRISSLVKDNNMCLDLGRLEGTETYFSELKSRGRCAPQAPGAFAEAVGRLHFTNCADTAFVQDKYRETVVEVLADIEQLNYTELGWGDKDVEDLAQVLPLAPRLKLLYLSVNNIGDEGAVALARALPGCPALQNLNLWMNYIGNKGAIALAGVLPRCEALQVLDLRWNKKIGASGSKALRRAARATPTRGSIELGLDPKGGCCVLQ